MLNIMPITIAIMPQFIIVTRLAQLGSSRECYFSILPVVLGYSALILTYYTQYYALEKTSTSFYTKLWLHYYITEDFIKTFKILPIMLALCLILSETYYAGIIGLGLAVCDDVPVYVCLTVSS